MFLKRSVLKYSGILLMISCINAGPLRQEEIDPEISAGKFEGDMILTEEQVRALTLKIQGRNGLVDESKRWPNNIVYYKIVGNFGKFGVIFTSLCISHPSVLNGKIVAEKT